MKRLLPLLLLLAGCPGGSGSSLPAGSGGTGGTGSIPHASSGSETRQSWELEPVRDLDLLFVVGNGPGMAARQNQLASALPTLFEQLGRLPGGMPNLHVGVVSSDLGAGSRPLVSDCVRPGGDRAILQAGKCGLGATDRFLTSAKGGTENNFTGAIADVAACMVRLGEGGCLYPHALQAARVALYESVTKENTGFLRDNAFLAVVIVADEDDCSGETTSDLFVDDAAFPSTAQRLRCSIAGHLCDGKQPPIAAFSAPLETCTANPRGRLIAVSDIVDSIRALKKRPDQQISMAAIAGSPADHPGATYQYLQGPDGKLQEASLCGGNSSVRAGLRIQQMIQAFGAKGRMFDACGSDLSEPVRGISSALVNQLSQACLSARPIDADPATPGVQPRCQASLLEPGATTYRSTAIPGCQEGGPRPCLRLVENPSCPASGVSVEIDRTGATLAPGTQVDLHCDTEVMLAPPGSPPMCTPPLCARVKALGQACTLGEAAPLQNQAVYRTDTPECPSGICLKPARSISVARAVDTVPTCTKACNTDVDCADAEVRDPKNGLDKKCAGGYACAVPFEVGPLCCRKLCVCKDFLPATGVELPAGCAMSAPPGASVCQGR